MAFSIHPPELPPLDEALFAAVERGDGDEALTLISRGANINAGQRYELLIDRERVPVKRTPLMTAILANNENLALTLLSVPGIDLEIDNAMSGRTPLMEATIRGNRLLVETLLLRGAALDTETPDGSTALALALEYGHPELAERLMGVGQPANPSELLVSAAYRGNVGVMRQLLAQGAEIEALNSAGDSPLVGAAWGGHDDVLIELLKRGADLARSGGRALGSAANSGKTSIVRLLIGHGVPIDVQDTTGWTPLMYAAWQDQPETVACLLELGANRRLTDNTGKTALDWAREGQHPAVVALLS